MKMPKTPPDFERMLGDIKDPSRLMQIIALGARISPSGKYFHWDKLQYHTPPEGFSREEWWLALKLKRKQQSSPVPLTDAKGKAFTYTMADPIPEMLQKIDQGAGGHIGMPDQITNPETRDRYCVNSLIQEAITSSQLEGAATTREVAKEMIRTQRRPRDHNEQMILNNFRTMQRVGALKDKKLSKELILEIHQIITAKTLKSDSETGRLRLPNERIAVVDMYNEVFHNPPPAEQLEERMAAMCDFANGRTPERFLHPVLRSIILHFWLAYDHPFVDGNGRVARALFYWSMLRHRYWLFEFVSISFTETDDNDLTYFILQQLDVIRRAMRELHEYIERKTAALHAIETRLRGVTVLNHRQQALIVHALRHPQQRYTFKSHQMSHNVVYQTARTDLLDLEQRGLLASRKVGRTWHFKPVPDLEARLARLD